jgi:hypothetical protein
VLAAAAALGLAACGDDGVDDANRYVDAVNASQQRFTSTLARLSGRITVESSPTQDQATLAAFDDAVVRAVRDLNGVEPPEDVADLHRRLVGDLDGYGARVRRETGLLRSDDPRRLLAAQEELLGETSAVSERLNATIAQINEQLRE